MKDIRISIRLSEQDHRKLKLISVKKGIPMQNLIYEYIKKIIKDGDSNEK